MPVATYEDGRQVAYGTRSDMLDDVLAEPVVKAVGLPAEVLDGDHWKLGRAALRLLYERRTRVEEKARRKPRG